MVTVAGSIAETCVCLRDTLAALPEFQNRADPAYDLDTAKARIYFDIVDQYHGDPHQTRPHAVIKFVEQGFAEIADGVQIDLMQGGSLVLALFDNARYGDDHGKSFLDFATFAGQVIDALTKAPGYDQDFPISGGEMVLSPVRTQRATRRLPDNDFWSVAWSMQYGE